MAREFCGCPDGKIRTLPLSVRFWRNVRKASQDDCWLWTGFANGGKNPKSGKDHGIIVLHGTPRHATGAHRVSWFLEHGSVPSLCVLHRCDVPRCVNPRHLFLGTKADNSNDRWAKGRRGNMAAGEKVGGHKLTEFQVKEIRSLYAPGMGSYRLAKRFGVEKSTILRILRRETWGHV